MISEMSRRSDSSLWLSAPPSRLLGMVVAGGAVAITTLVIYPVREVAPAVSTGVVYLLAVLLVSTYWGLWLGLLTALASASAFNWFHIGPTGRFTIADGQNWVALGVFLATALIASSVSELARSRAAEAERRREEADLAADMGRMLLAGNTLSNALAAASMRLHGNSATRTAWSLAACTCRRSRAPSAQRADGRGWRTATARC